ncbi:MAG TPA: extensin family protein [Kofleriaceae bacterium]|nr:extensin family protein [Kofleriaceae bacterium]
MRCPRLVLALVAGLAATTAAPTAFAQPIVSPHDVSDPPAKAAHVKPATDPMPIEDPKPATKAAPPAELAPAEKPAEAPPPTAAVKSEAPAKPSSTKHASTKHASTKHASAKHRATAKSASPKRSAAAKSPAKRSSKAKGKAKTKSKAKATKAAKAADEPAPAGARPAAVPMRGGGRADNMPHGFVWPASPAMKAAATSCEADLATLGVTWKPAAAEGRMVDPIEVPDGMLGGIKYTSLWQGPPHKLDCQLARALAQVGQDLHALGVREVKWGSIYRWSNVRTQGTELPYLSRHALGLAMDIVELVDDAGRVANVKRDYLADDALLLGVERLVNTSGRFRILLTPKNDPKSHHDHFHVEANPDYAAP